MKVKDLMKEFEINYIKRRLKPNTVSGYVNNIKKYIIPHVGEIDISKVDYSVLDSFVENMEKSGLSNTSIIYVLAVLRKSYSFALKRGYVNSNVLYSYDFPLRKKFRVNALSLDEVKKMLDCKTIIQKLEYIYPAVLLAVCYGMRRGEILGLKSSDIEYESGIISVSKTRTTIKGSEYVTDCKTHSGNRQILVSHEHMKVLHDYDTWNCCNSEGYFIRGGYGNLISSSCLNKAFKRYLSSCGCRNVRFHDLRHTYATVMLKNGVNPLTVSKTLGHSSIKVTLDIYGNYDLSFQRENIKMIQSLGI